MSFFTVALLWLVQAATAAPSVAVSYFENTGNDAEMAPLQKGLAEMLITDLSVSKAITIVERSRLNDVLDEVKLQKNPFFDPKDAAKLGRGLGADFLITGSYLVMDDKIRIDARVVDVESSEVVLSVKTMGDTSAWASLEIDLASKLLEGLGSQLSLIDKKNIGKDTTRTFSAFSAYSQAVDHLDEGRAAEAKAAFETALAADPDFQRARTSLSEVSKRVQQVRTQLAEEASNFEDKVQTMVARHAGGDTQACIGLSGVLAQEFQLIQMWTMMSQLKDMPSPSGMDPMAMMPQAQGAPKSKKEAGQRLYRILRLAQATRTQDLKPVQIEHPAGTYTCHPEAVLISSGLTSMAGLVTSIRMRRSGQATYGMDSELRPVDDQGQELSDEQILELYLTEANRLLELSPKEATQRFGTMIDWVVEELKTQRLPAAERAEAERGQQIDRFIKSVESKKISFYIEYDPRMGGMVVGHRQSRSEPLAMRHMAVQYGDAQAPDGPADYRGLIKGVWYSCADEWCTWPFLGEAPANPHMPKDVAVHPGFVNLLGIEYFWPTGMSDVRPVTILVELIDGRAIEVSIPAPLSPAQKRTLLLQAVGPILGAMNVCQANDYSINDTIESFLKSADDPMKGSIQAGYLGIDESTFKDIQKLYTQHIEVHPNRQSISSPEAAASTAADTPAAQPWSLWRKGKLDRKSSLKSFRWVTSHAGKENVPLTLEQITTWTPAALDSALAARRRGKGANAPMQGHVIRLEAGETIDLRVTADGFVPEIGLAAPGYMDQSFISTTNAAECKSGFSVFTKTSESSRCLSDWPDCSFCPDLAKIIKVDAAKGTTEVRITAPPRERSSFHFLFVGTGNGKTEADYTLELRAHDLKFVQVAPEGKSGSVKPFMMSTTEITNWQWFKIMGEIPGACTGIGRGLDGTNPLSKACGLNRPVKKINWYQAAQFANALSVREGLKPAYAIQMGREPSAKLKPGVNGYRLPTLAEWEAAALIDEPMVPLEERCAIANSLELSGVTVCLEDAQDPTAAKMAMACDDGFGALAPVGSFAPNKFGLYDMLGNVWEWVWDDQENKPKAKGGGYSLLIQKLSPALTEVIPPDSKGDPLGMRLVRPLE